MKYQNHILTKQSATIVFTGPDQQDFVKTIRRTDDRFDEVSNLIKEKRYDQLVEVLDVPTAIARASDDRLVATRDRTTGEVKVQDKEGNVMPAALVEKIQALSAKSLDTSPLEAFWQGSKKKGGARGLVKNPSENSRHQLYDFLRNNEVNITQDGYFIMYKGVRADGYSRHRATHVVACSSDTSVDGKTKWVKGDTVPMRHVVGQILEIPRKDCVDNKHQDCAAGLHAAPWNSRHILSGGMMMEVLIDPADVVSVPDHTNGGKLRACRYRIIREMKDGDQPHDGKEVVRPRIAKKTARGQRIEKAMESGEGGDKARVEFNTDRITIPFELCHGIGVSASDKVRLVTTDPRSRFIAVLGTNADAVLKQILKRPAPVIDETVKASSRGSLSIRDRILRLARISGAKEYDISLVRLDSRTKYLEIRPVK